MEKKAKQGIMWYSADLASFLFKCAWKTLFLGFRAKILLLCAEILPLLRFVQKYYWPGTRGSLDSRAGPFLGSVKKYWFFGEIFTSGLGLTPRQQDLVNSSSQLVGQEGGSREGPVLCASAGALRGGHQGGGGESQGLDRLSCPKLIWFVYFSLSFLPVHAVSDSIKTCHIFTQ